MYYNIFIKCKPNPFVTYYQNQNRSVRSMRVEDESAMRNKVEELRASGTEILGVYTHTGKRINL